MTAELWIAVAVGIAIGAGAVALVSALRTRREATVNTLVPHRTRQLMNAMQSGAIIVRRDRRSSFCNPPAVALGLARPDGALYGDVADLAEQAWLREEPIEGEVGIKRGVLAATSYVHVRVTPLDDELCLAVANDFTEARAAEQSRREFAVNVSHELKTPIGALSLIAETMAEAADDEEAVRKFAKRLRKEARRLTKLIEEIIEVSRLQGGASVIEHEPVQVEGVVHEAIESMRLAAEPRGITLVPDLKARPVVLADHDLLLMAVRNLVDNAVQYSDDSSQVTVSVGVTDGVASVSVIDRGIGISAADQERIFERFYRADPARARDTGGTGLGLSIVKHIALQHAGSVSVWSEVGVGSTFTLKLNEYREEA